MGHLYGFFGKMSIPSLYFKIRFLLLLLNFMNTFLKTTMVNFVFKSSNNGLFLIFIYVAVSALSCSTWDLHCIIQDLSLLHTESIYGARA